MSAPTKTVMKKAKPKEVVVIHSCTEQKTLERICLILFGNGHPEDGLAFLVREYIKNMDGIKKDVGEIRTRLSGVTEVSNELELQNRVRIEVEKEKQKIKEAQNVEEGKTSVRKSFTWQKFAVTVATLSFLTMAAFSILNYFKTDNTEKKVDELGSPVVVNPRGEFVPLPEGFSLKMYPKDFDTDTLKNKEVVK
jgi:hypothetical protein